MTPGDADYLKSITIWGGILALGTLLALALARRDQLHYWYVHWRIGRKIRRMDWPSAHVIQRAWGQEIPSVGETRVWYFACGDCRIVFQAIVTQKDPFSFHPECPSCAEKMRIFVAERDRKRQAASAPKRNDE